MRLVWADTIVEEANLSQNVFTLRKALGEGPHEHRYIATVPRRGYQFVAEVRETPVPGTPGRRRRRRAGPKPRARWPSFRSPRSGERRRRRVPRPGHGGRADHAAGEHPPASVVRPTSAMRAYAGRTPDPVAGGPQPRAWTWCWRARSSARASGSASPSSSSACRPARPSGASASTKRSRTSSRSRTRSRPASPPPSSRT